MRWAASAILVTSVLFACGVLEDTRTPSRKPVDAPAAGRSVPSAARPTTPPDGPPVHAARGASTWRPRPGDPTTAEHPIEDPSGHALDGFYAALARTEAGAPGALTRVSHMGDSSIGMDQLPHYLRSSFQDRFGDGGAGFVLLQPHSASYRNQMVRLSTPVPWDFCFIIFRCRRDGHYGLGGVATEARGGATTLVRTLTDGPRGRSASRVELWYAGMPGGGDLELTIDGGDPIRIPTAADALEDRWHEERVEPGEHRVRVRAGGGGRVRAYGLVLESDGPGVVWDTHSMIGAFTVRVLAQDPRHFARQLQHRGSDLVMLGYGGNDLRRYASRGVTLDDFQQETVELLERVRAARPEAGCLLTGVVEHEMSGRTRIRPHHVQALVDAQRAAAARAGCAFFDVYGAMGGAGSARRWRREGLAAPDLKHLTPRGRRVVAGWLFDALMTGYGDYRRAELERPALRGVEDGP
jgi:lysophospholipase L1-like esterase